LDNDFYGTTFSANYKQDKWDVILVGYNKYEGSHFGKVIWSHATSELGDRYYDFCSKKQMEIFS
jgi:iron complex outermembrane receptor protein